MSDNNYVTITGKRANNGRDFVINNVPGKCPKFVIKNVSDNNIAAVIKSLESLINSKTKTSLVLSGVSKKTFTINFINSNYAGDVAIDIAYVKNTSSRGGRVVKSTYSKGGFVTISGTNYSIDIATNAQGYSNGEAQDFRFTALTLIHEIGHVYYGPHVYTKYETWNKKGPPSAKELLLYDKVFRLELDAYALLFSSDKIAMDAYAKAYADGLRPVWANTYDLNHDGYADKFLDYAHYSPVVYERMPFFFNSDALTAAMNPNGFKLDYKVGDPNNIYATWVKYREDGMYVEVGSCDLAELGQNFGSTLGLQLAGKSEVVGVLAGSILGTVAYNIGQTISFLNNNNVGYGGSFHDPSIKNDALVQRVAHSTNQIWSDFGNELRDFTVSSAIGSVSSYLSMELGNALGLKGFGAEMFQAGASSLLGNVLSNIVGNAVAPLAGIVPDINIFKDGVFNAANAGQVLGSAMVSFFATKLASMIYSPQTQAGMVLSSLGAAAGAIAASSSTLFGTVSSAIATGLSNMFGIAVKTLLPGVGVFIGFLLGAIIGDLFGHRKPRLPTAYADLTFNGSTGRFELGASGVSNGGNLELAQYMQKITRETLNGIVDTVSAGQAQKQPWAWNMAAQFGHDNNQTWVKIGGASASKTNVNSADEAVDKFVMYALGGLNIRGGNMFIKRAIKRTLATSVAVLSGDMQIAEDYGFYLQNRSVIDAAIAEPYTSMKLITADYLLWARNTGYINEYKADAANEDPNGKDLAKIRAWGEKKAKSLGLDLVNSTYQVSAGVDSAFYDANKSFMTRAMAKDSVPLTGNDLNFYNNNQTQIDRIISRLALTQFAASWIITLQRAAELNINKASSTDFIGGAGGFADSLKLMSGSGDDPLFYDSLKFTMQSDNTTLRVSYKDGGTNRVRGADFSDGVGFIQDSWQPGGVLNKNVQQVDGEAALLVTGNGGHYADWNYTYSGAFRIYGGDRSDGYYSVRGGQKIGISIDYKALQSGVRMDSHVAFWDANGNYINHQTGMNGDSGNSNWQTLKAVVTAPPNAAYATIENWVLKSGYNMGQNFGVAVRHMQFEDLSSTASSVSDIPAWSGSSYSNFDLGNFFADVGYNNSGSTTYTGGNNYEVNALEASSSNQYYNYSNWSSNMTIRDTYTTSVWVDDYEWMDNGWGYSEYVYVGQHEETQTFSGGNDVYITGYGNDTLEGLAGDDWLDGNAGNDRISGGDGDDVLIGREGKDGIRGGAGDDYISLGAGDDYTDWYDPLNGGGWGDAGNDTLSGGGGQDYLAGGTGDDTFIVDDDGGITWDWYDGEDGQDTISYIKLTTGITIDLQPRAGWGWGPNARAFWGDGFQSIENITGTNYADTIYGDEIGNVLKGMYGDDSLYGRAGDDTLEGGQGSDRLDGNEGNDTASYKDSQSAVWVDLTATADNLYAGEGFGGDAEGDTYYNIENITGSALADTLKGTSGYNVIKGEKGDDWIIVTAGYDNYQGGDGFDTLDFSEMTGAVHANLSSGGEYWATGSTFSSIEHLYGSNYNDTFYGSAADETFTGGKGNDYISGGDGNDTYVFNKGDGFDTLDDNFVGSNSIVFGEGITWSDLTFQTNYYGSGQALWMTVRGTSEGVLMYNNFTASYTPNNKIKSIDVGGAGALDVTKINHGAAGGTGNDYIVGKTNTNDWQWGYEGDDTILGAATTSADEQNDNIIVGGQGNDTIYTSIGDDTFVFERGHGIDTINDKGGRDRIVIGSTATMDDVIYKVVGYDLYVGLKDSANPSLGADQVADRIRIVNGGYRYVDYAYGTPTGNTSFSVNMVEHVTAGGAEIDFTKLDIAWTDVVRDVSYYGGGGNGGYGNGNYYVPPVVFDLGGDGVDLISSDESPIVVQSSVNGLKYQMGWVSGDDGILALDRNGDGAITNLSEISFTSDLAGAKTDLEGLKAYDTNNDGVLDAKDARFGDFMIWRDVNQNGRGKGKELQSLAKIGITSISLSLTATGYTTSENTGNVVINTASFTWSDGTSGTANDVALKIQLADLTGPELGAGNRSWLLPNGDGELGRAKTSGKASLQKRKLKAGEAYGSQNLDFIKADAGDGTQELKKVVKKKRTFAEMAADKANGNVTPSAGGAAPIIIDMDGNGISLVEASNSNVWADLNEDGWADKIGWAGAGEGILAIDRDGDGLAQALSEVSFLNDLPGAKTDLEGLKAYDSNNDNWIDSKDAKFASFMIWQDKNQDGVSSYDEMASLDEAGIDKIGLFYNDKANVTMQDYSILSSENNHTQMQMLGIEEDANLVAELNTPIATMQNDATATNIADLNDTSNKVFGHMEVHFKNGKVVSAADVAFGSINGLSIDPFANVDDINDIAVDDEYDALDFGQGWSMNASKRRSVMESMSQNGNDNNQIDNSNNSQNDFSDIGQNNSLTSLSNSDYSPQSTGGLGAQIELAADIFVGSNANHSLSGQEDWLYDEASNSNVSKVAKNVNRWWVDGNNTSIIKDIGSKTLAQTLTGQNGTQSDAPEASLPQASGQLLSSADAASMRRDQAFAQAISQFKSPSKMYSSIKDNYTNKTQNNTLSTNSNQKTSIHNQNSFAL